MSASDLMSPMGRAALKTAAKGWPVLPCCPKTKKPLTKHGYKDATIDPREITSLWRQYPKAMIGVRTGSASGVWVLDADAKLPAFGASGPQPSGLDSLKVIQMKHGSLPQTLEATTQGGGRHLYFRHHDGIGVSAGKVARGIDVRGDGGYIIVAPSEAEGGRYTWIDDTVQPADAPEWLINLVLPKQSEPERPIFDEPLRRVSNGSRPAYGAGALVSECERIRKAGNGTRNATLNEAAFKLGQLVAGGELDEAEVRHRLGKAAGACGLVKEDGPASVKKTIESGIRAGKKSPRSAPEPEVKRQPQPNHSATPKADQQGSQSDGPLHRLNKEYCVVRDAGRTRVLYFEPHVQKQHRRLVATFASFEDFRNFHLNDKVRVGDKEVPLGHWWLRHPDRRQYDGLTFEPGGGDVIDGRLNLWRGWGVEPKPGKWALMRRHIEEVLAAGDSDAATYIINWCAWAFQHPAERAQAALVFRGKRGTGKGTLGNALCRIYGQHATHVSSADHLAGRFNGHLRDACLLFADEAYWPGDKGAEGSLKRLITEPDLFVEAKGRDGVTVANRLHVIMASNEDWIVPAGEDERRYAVFQVSQDRLQSEAWFSPIYAELEAGGYGAMLHDLLHLDLGDWHPRRVPRTDALLGQQSRGLSPQDSWWVELLETGTLWGAEPGKPNRAVSNGYEDTIEGFHGSRKIKVQCLYDQARAVSPKLRNVSDHALGDFLRDKGCSNIQKVMRRRGWTFPLLAQARAEWEERFPRWPWRDPNLSGWQEVGDGDA